jgi:carbamoyltransferase
MKLLGLGSPAHDANMSYFDGEKVHYYKYERIHNSKHMPTTHLKMIADLPKVFGVTLDEIDAVGYVSDWRLDELQQLQQKTDSHNFDIAIQHKPTSSIEHPNTYLVSHHLSHAKSAWMMEEDEDISVVIDGIGDGKTCSIWRDMELVAEINPANGSFGWGFIEVSEIMGIKAKFPLDYAGKLMGLQSYGKPIPEYLEHLQQYNLLNEYHNIFKWEEFDIFYNYSALNRHRMLDWAATVHKRAGELIFDIFNLYCKPTDKIIYSGGVALNVLYNTELIKQYPNIVIPPHCSDEGLSLGVLEVMRKHFDLPKMKIDNFPYCQMDEAPEEVNDDTINQVAKLLAEGNVVAWYQGNGEMGPRALGNRSILMDPRIVDGKQKVNRIKNREDYRPFGASVLQSHSEEAFDDIIEDKYMLFTAKPKCNYPAITHVDGTCRVQTVGDENINFKKLLESFYNLTGCPVLLNTSLNMAGTPIASEIVLCKMLLQASPLDYIVYGNTVKKKI